MNQLLKVSLGTLPNIIVSDPSFKDSSWNQHVINPLPDGIYEMDAYAKPVDMGRDSYVQFDFLIRHLIPEMERMPLVKLSPEGGLKLNEKLLVIGEARKIGLNEPKLCITRLCGNILCTSASISSVHTSTLSLSTAFISFQSSHPNTAGESPTISFRISSRRRYQ